MFIEALAIRFVYAIDAIMGLTRTTAATFRFLLSTLVALGFIASGSSVAEPVEVDLELVLAADISDSMDPREQQLQRAGYAAAFRDPEIIAAIGQGPLGRIAVTFVEWADLAQPRVTVPWRLIDGAEMAHAFAAELEASAIARMHRTSISGALSFSGHLLDHNGFAGTRRVIDVSGDGPNNQGESAVVARDVVLARGVVINGLPILINLDGPKDPFRTSFDKRKLDIYYEDCVIGGPGAFMVPIRSRDQLIDGIRHKLLLEIVGSPTRIILAAQQQRPRLPC